MKKRILSVFLAMGLLLGGCGWPGGSYVSVEPHREQRQDVQTGAITAGDYQSLCDALEGIVASGTESATIQVADYPADTIEQGLLLASRYITRSYPLGAYAVKELSYELGTSVGQPAVAVTVRYTHGASELRRIRVTRSEEETRRVITDALGRMDASVVLLRPSDAIDDVTQLVQDYARENPQTVMEIPQVTETDYGVGDQRVTELIFTYQTDRDALRRMQAQVKPVFDSAVLYVSGDDAERQKFAQLYAFLMERFDYKLETSITPTYSLLRHGVGDSRAFATVYAAMCRAAGLNCAVVTGAHDGEPWTWNMVLEDGHYYHVDLLRSSALGAYQTFTDAEMDGYVWDYSNYPASTGAPAQPEETETLG